jgi:hypothetical protein
MLLDAFIRILGINYVCADKLIITQHTNMSKKQLLGLMRTTRRLIKSHSIRISNARYVHTISASATLAINTHNKTIAGDPGNPLACKTCYTRSANWQYV